MRSRISFIFVEIKCPEKMSPLFKKLYLKDQEKLLIVQEPEFIRKEVKKLPENVKVIKRIDQRNPVSFAMIFVQHVAQIEKLLPRVDNALKDDGILWLAFPKHTSKRYPGDISRKHPIWEMFPQYGYRAVTNLNLNTDWNAVRYRRERYIKRSSQDDTRQKTESDLKTV